MRSRNRVDELQDFKNLPGGIDRYMLGGLHANTDETFREAHQNDEPMNEQVARFNRELQKMVESSESMQELAQQVIQLDTDRYEVVPGEHQNFVDFVEQKASEVYSEDVVDVFGREFIETLGDVSELGSNDLRYRLNEVSGLDDAEYDFRNRVAAWAEHSETERVAELLASKYLENLDDSVERFFIKDAAEKLFSEPESGYRRVLDEIDELDMGAGLEYMNELEASLEAERNNVLTIEEERVIEDLEGILNSVETHYRLAAETEDLIKSVKKQYPGHGDLIADRVEDIYSRPLDEF